MDKSFPLEYIRRCGVVFDVSEIVGRDVDIADVDLDRIREAMFVIFYTGTIERHEYGSKTYFSEHAQLSDELIEALLKRKVSMIGIDAAGVRRGKEHTPKDQYCADRGVFIIENLCNLKSLVHQETVTVYTFPMNYAGMSGLPCRVVAEIPEE